MTIIPKYRYFGNDDIVIIIIYGYRYKWKKSNVLYCYNMKNNEMFL